MKKLTMHTSKEEVERVLANRSKKIIEETHKRGFPVRIVDEVGKCLRLEKGGIF